MNEDVKVAGWRERLLTPDEAAGLVNVSTKTLKRWSDRGEFPRPVKCGGLVRYIGAAVAEWMDGLESKGRLS